MIAKPEIAIHRRSICENCEHNKIQVCVKCNCIIPFKTSLKTAKCPEGKW